MMNSTSLRSMKRACLALAGGCVLGLSAPVRADDGAVPWPQDVRNAMVRLAEVSWRLRRAAGGLCPREAAASGLVLDYVGAYHEQDRELVRTVLGMSLLPQIAAVLPGSPAHAAGIQAGDDLLAIDGLPVSQLFARSHDPALLADEIEAHLVAGEPGKPVHVLLRRESGDLDVTVHPLRLCSARLVLKVDDSLAAYSDSENVAITTGMIRFTRNDDELALIAGHELAHVINRDGDARSIAHRRRMEDSADSLGAALAHCAGYDLDRAFAFWERFRKGDVLGWLRIPTHRSSRNRLKRLLVDETARRCPPLTLPER